MFPIFKRELRAYFTSPIGYIFIAFYLALSGGLFSLLTLWQNTVSTGGYFIAVLFLFILMIPLLTMKLFSEERKMKTEQILLTAPISIFGMVFGKFLAAFVMFAGTFLVSCLVNFFYLGRVSGMVLNTAQILGNIVGILLIGAAFIALGIFLSSLTENQLIAAVSTLGTILLCLGISFLPNYINSPGLRNVIQWFSIVDRFSPFTNGIFSLPSVIFFFSLAVVFLFLTTRVYEKRRWE